MEIYLNEKETLFSGELITNFASLSENYKDISDDALKNESLNEKSENMKIKDIARKKEVAGICPDCGGVLVQEEGCITCHDCGYSRCG